MEAGIVAEQVKLQPASQSSAICFSGAPFPAQLSANVHEKAAKDGPGIWAQHSCGRLGRIPGSQFWLDPPHNNVITWGVNQWLKDLLLCLTLFLLVTAHFK